MKFNELKKEISKFLDENYIKINKVIIDAEDTYMVNLTSKKDKSDNCISLKIEDSERFGIYVALFSSEDYYFDGDDILNQVKQKIIEETKNLKYFNVYGNDGNLLSSDVFIEEGLDENKVCQMLENNFIFCKGHEPKKVVIYNFDGEICFQQKIY